MDPSNSGSTTVETIKGLAANLGLEGQRTEDLEISVREREAEQGVGVLEAAVAVIKPQLKYLVPVGHSPGEYPRALIASTEDDRELFIRRDGSLDEGLNTVVDLRSAVRGFGLERILSGIRELLEAAIKQMGERRAKLAERLDQILKAEKALGRS